MTSTPWDPVDDPIDDPVDDPVDDPDDPGYGYPQRWPD